MTSVQPTVHSSDSSSIADESLLQVTNLNIDFQTAEGLVRVVHNLSFHINSGETLALVGESGSGKTATSLAVLDLLPGTAVRSGSIQYRGQELVGAPRGVIRSVRGCGIAMVFQEPMTALNPLYTAEQLLTQALRSHKGADSGRRRERCIELLAKVRMPEPEQKLRSYPHQLSGGQRQRLMIAIALAGGAEVLIADEPTTALDATVQVEILRLLSTLRDELGMALLLITHDMGVVAGLADRVIVMETGRAVETGDALRVFEHPETDFTKTLLSSVPRVDVGKGRESSTMRADANVVVSIRDVDVTFRRGLHQTQAIQNLSLDVRAGESVGIVGESGSGKSTLARAVLGLAKVDSGSIDVAGHSVTSGKRRDLRSARSNMGMVFQDPASSLDPRRTIGQSLVEPLRQFNRNESRAELRKIAHDLLESVQLPPAWTRRYPHELSGGQKQRVAIARVLGFSPKVIIADEPTAALDMTIQAKVVHLLTELQRERGFALIFVSHDLGVVSNLTDRVAVMQAGRLVEVGETEDLLARPKDDYTRSLLSSVLAPDPRIARAAVSER